jgi:predicted transcriptional regulator
MGADAMDQAMGRDVRLAGDVAGRLEELARRRQIPAEQLAQEAVAEYLDRADRRATFLQETLDAWAEYQTTGLHLTGPEADEWLAGLEAGDDADPPPPHT